jgi:hypothetical protein
MTVRWVISHAVSLPEESRISKYFRDDNYTYNEHLLADVVDAARIAAYYSSLGAAAQIGKKFAEYAKKQPSPMERPTVQPKKKEPVKFTPLSVVKAKLQGGFDKEAKEKVKKQNEMKRLLGGE